MSMRRMIILVVACMGCSFTAEAQDAVKVEATQVRGNIYMITGQGGNIGLLNGDDGSFLIDDQYAPLTEKILEAVKSVGGDVPRFLINTHFHGDHTGGNENLGKTGTLIMSHHEARQRLLDGSFIATFGMKSGPASKAALPTITYSENMHLHINNETVKVIYAPNAHTDGDSFVVFEKANVVHAGDLFFNGFFPFVDGPNGGTVKGVIAGSDAMLALTNNDSKIIPGHGPLASKKDLKAAVEMLTDALDRVRQLVDAGQSEEEILAANPLKVYHADWNWRFITTERMTRTLYRELTDK